MNITPIYNHIIFEFIDKLNLDRQFTETTASGIHVVGDHNSSANAPRWARIIATGPDVEPDLLQGHCEILIDNLRWTEGVLYAGKKYWRTDDNQVLAYRTAE